MKSIKTLVIYIFICCIPALGSAQSITVDDTYTAQNLVDILTSNSTCATTSNATIKGDTFSGTQKSYGYFTSGTSNFPFTKGIVLSTWSSKNSIGPFIRNQGGGDTRWLGDSDLDQALGITSINATVLEFDFLPLTNFISFNYLFASNEYQDYFPCEYSDGFAFLIKKADNIDSYRNLAILPGSTAAVSSQSVHPVISYQSNQPVPPITCPAENENYFGQFNTTGPNVGPINFAGQTKILTAQTSVIPGQKYHIKLVIADARNTVYDSAVFLEASSFRSKIDLGTDRLLLTNTGICFGENYVINTNLPATNTYRWYKNNSITPIPGEFGPSLIVTDAGTYRVELDTTNCISSGEIKIEYTPQTILNNTTLIQCDENNDGIAIFDLTKADAIIKNNNAGLSDILYFATRTDALLNANPILTPKNYNSTSTNQVVFARTLNNYNCPIYAQITLAISNQTIATPPPIIVCDDDGTNDGFYQFDLMSIATSGAFNGIGNSISVYFYLTQSDAYLEKNQLTTLFRNTIKNEQTIYARIINGSDCYGIVPISLVIKSFYPLNFQDTNISLCNGNTTNIAVAAGFDSYLWNTGATTNSINVTSAANYSVLVSNVDGCTATKKFHITDSGIATITGAVVTDFSANENSVLLEYSGIGDYEFSIDGAYFQDNPQFDGIAAGTYIASARDKNGCGLSNDFVFYVLDYPRYFTPNGDSYNDYWTIKNLDLLPKSTITIFDRYGKLLKQVFASSNDWNGTFNGAALPADDYWFNITFEDGKIIKGHFSLKR
jgi:gliding motility-associated-like protein